MNRRTTILLAGFLTAGVITGIVSFAYNASASTAGVALDTSSATIEEAAIEGVAESSATVDLVAVYQEREAALQARVAEGEKAIATLDATMQPQIDDLNAEILILTSRAAEKAQNALALQDSAAQLQAQIEQEGQAFQLQVGSLQERDSQTRTQLDAALGELQAAYDLLATRQASVASSSGSSNGGDSSSNSSSNSPSQVDEEEDGDEAHDGDEEHGDDEEYGDDENEGNENEGDDHHEDEDHESHEEEDDD